MEYPKPVFNYRSKVVIFDLKKPIWGSVYSLYEGHFRGKDDWKIVVKTDFGKSTYENFREYKKGAKLILVPYNFPDNPMRMWERAFLPDVKKRKERKKKEKKVVVPEIHDISPLKSVYAEIERRSPELMKLLGRVPAEKR